MVVVASPQPNELEQKKKRQTLERAKANHLSKQLQMRLQYAKLKVEHGWQRQNLNEVENLYFHHSHLRSMRQRPHYATVTHPSAPPTSLDTHVLQSPVPDPSSNDPLSGSVSPPSRSPMLGAEPSCPPVQTVASSTLMNRPPSAFDLSDPNILARLVQLTPQGQIPSQWQSQYQGLTLTRQPSTTSTSTPASQPVPTPLPAPTPIPGAFPPHGHSEPSTSHPHPGPTFPAFVPQPLFSTPTPGSVPFYPTPAPNLTTTPHLPVAALSQSPVPTPTPTTVPASASASVPAAPISTTPIPTSAPIAPTALTYDSFWSTHASSTGPTRALYRTHTGFTASATPGGNVAMLTPGGHAAVMTSEGVYVGGATGRSG